MRKEFFADFLDIYKVKGLFTNDFQSESALLQAWRMFFKYGIIAPEASDELRAAGQLFEQMMMNSEEYEMARRMEVYEEVYWDSIAYAKEQGIEQGVEQGIAQERAELLKSFAQVMTVEQLAEHTHLSVDEVKRIVGEADPDF